MNMYETFINTLVAAQEMNIAVSIIEGHNVMVGKVESITEDMWGHRITVEGETVCINRDDITKGVIKGGKNYFTVCSPKNTGWNVTVII